MRCAVCGSSAEAFQKLDKDAINQLAKLEGGTEEQGTFDDVRLKWSKDALKELRTIPDGYQMRRAKAQIEKRARVQRIPTITLDMVRSVIAGTTEELQNLTPGGHLKTPGEHDGGSRDAPVRKAMQDLVQDGEFMWAPDAHVRLGRVPEGFMRTRTKERIEAVARDRKTDLITLAITEEGIKEGLKLMEEMIKEQATESSDS